MTQDSQRDPARDISERGLSAHVRATPVVGKQNAIKAVPLGGTRLWWYSMKVMFGSDEDQRMPRSKADQKQINEVIHPEALAEKASRDQEWLTVLEEAHRMNAAFNEAHRREQLRRESHAEIREKSSKVRSGSFLVLGAKGSSAVTTTAVHFSATLAEYGRVLLTLVDGNPAAGLCAARLGMNHGDTVTIQDMAIDLKGDSSITTRRFRDEISKAKSSINGVRVVGADNIIDEKKRLNSNGMNDVLTLLTELSEYVVIDTANDVGDPPTRKAAEWADCYIFTANANIPYSLRLLSTTMETLRGQGPKQAQKVNRSVVVISNIPPGKTEDDYRFYLNEVNIEDKVIRPLEHLFEGVFMGVNYDPYLALDRIVDLDKLDWGTLQAYFNMVNSGLNQIATLRSLASPTSRVANLASRQACGERTVLDSTSEGSA